MRPDNRSAFTLVEVLVVIAITSLLAGLILSYSSNSRDRVALSVEQAKLSQTIAKAKSLTISTYNQPEVPCGYGVRFHYEGAEAGTYTLFSYRPNPTPPQCNLAAPDLDREEEISTNSLPENLAFEAPASDSIDSVLFIPPNPDTWIWLYGAAGTSTEGRVPIASKSGDFSVDVLVSSAGQISF